MAPRGGSNSQIYHDDLAHIHVDGYGFHWSRAADAILDWFHEFGITGGTVVDLGCGGGARLGEAGYDACGIDVSKSMISLARRNAPQAKLACGSFADVAIPACDAATSLGEPMNYLSSDQYVRRLSMGSEWHSRRVRGSSITRSDADIRSGD